MKVYTVNAFTHNEQGGNPAGVVLDAGELNETDMQNTAKEIGFSETAFVSSSPNADYKIRFFTPEKEVDLCGHATIASFHILREKNLISPKKYTMETKAGVLEIECQEDGLIYMQQNLPIFREVIQPQEIAGALSLSPEQFADHIPIQIASTGLHKIFAPIVNIASLEAIHPDYEKIIEISKKYQVVGIYAFTLDVDEATARCRNFAPLYGIFEDSATGTSCAALSCYLHHHKILTEKELVFQQGYSIDQPSAIFTRLYKEADKISKIEVAGRAKTTGEKNL